MAIISWQHGYLFLQAPRTACTAVANVLIRHLDGTHIPREHRYDERGQRVLHQKHAALSGLLRAGELTAEQAAALFKFTTTRNPFDREVSLYAKMRSSRFDEKVTDAEFQQQNTADYADAVRARSMGFTEWLAHRFGCRRVPSQLWSYRARRLRPNLIGGGHAQGVDFVMRFERLQVDFDEVLSRLGISQHYEIPVMNVTDGRERDYRSYYDRRARKIVSTVYGADLRRYGYEF